MVNIKIVLSLCHYTLYLCPDLYDAILVDRITTFQVNDMMSSVVHLVILEDFTLEGDEMFTLRGELSSETAAFVEILPPNPKVTIKNNDGE